MQAELAGVVPIVVTPFDERGRVDEEAIATLVNFERLGLAAQLAR
jgi:dihydrodipicolinate synthase/N-acetylneuraminate lyase